VIGAMMAQAFEKVGQDGVITVEEGKTAETTLEFVEGMQFDKGYISPYFVTDATEMKAVLEDAYILIFEKKLSGVARHDSAAGKDPQLRQALLIVADDCRKRSSSGSRRQSAPQRSPGLCRQGPGLWRSPKALMGRHRHPHGRPVHQR